MLIVGLLCFLIGLMLMIHAGGELESEAKHQQDNKIWNAIVLTTGALLSATGGYTIVVGVVL